MIAGGLFRLPTPRFFGSRPGNPLACLAAVLMALSSVAAEPRVDDKEKAMAAREEARLLLHRGFGGKAVSVLEKAARRYPRTEWGAACQFDAARVHHLRGDLEDAYEAYQVLQNDFPGSSRVTEALQAQWQIARQAVRTHGRARRGRVSPAERSQLPEPVVVERMLRLLLKNGRQWDEAAEVRYMLSVWYDQEGEVEKARDSYLMFGEDYPNHVLADDAAFQVAVIDWRQIGDGRDAASIDRATASLEDFLVRHPGSDREAEALHRLGQLRDRQVGKLLEVAAFYARTGKGGAADFYREQAAKLAETEIFPADRTSLLDLPENETFWWENAGMDPESFPGQEAGETEGTQDPEGGEENPLGDRQPAGGEDAP